MKRKGRGRENDRKEGGKTGRKEREGRGRENDGKEGERLMGRE